MNRLSMARRAQVIGALVEGNSINATCRMFGVGKHTVLRLLEDAGRACAAFHDDNVRGVRCQRVQCDEVWSFVGAKMKNVSEKQAAAG
jgi:transposase